ncbi:IclR family transcriptional regulator [Halodurantibacterium flavum]|uniref:IclR family transcriptional regulator n=1 Tax=Halodurantibacterium flavum TaxID=1382802 RepID=A0ABW4S1M2_9RHOB
MTTANSFEKGLRILDLFREDRLEWTAEEMMEELGYPRPTLYRYIRTLRDAGLLTALSGAGFTLGPRVVEFDYLMRKSDQLVTRSQPHLEALTAAWPCTALAVRWYGQRILCVASECSTPNPLSSYPRGRPMPLARGAISRSIIAFLPRAQMQQMIEQNLAEFGQVGLGKTAAEIAERFREVRRAGHAVAYGEVTPGVVGIAAPVFDGARAPVASLCVTIAGSTLTGERIEEIAAHVRRAAEEVTKALSPARAIPPGGQVPGDCGADGAGTMAAQGPAEAAT